MAFLQLSGSEQSKIKSAGDKTIPRDFLESRLIYSSEMVPLQPRGEHGHDKQQKAPGADGCSTKQLLQLQVIKLLSAEQELLHIPLCSWEDQSTVVCVLCWGPTGPGAPPPDQLCLSWSQAVLSSVYLPYTNQYSFSTQEMNYSPLASCFQYFKK